MFADAGACNFKFGQSGTNFQLELIARQARIGAAPRARVGDLRGMRVQQVSGSQPERNTGTDDDLSSSSSIVFLRFPQLSLLQFDLKEDDPSLSRAAGGRPAPSSSRGLSRTLSRWDPMIQGPGPGLGQARGSPADPHPDPCDNGPLAN